MNDRDREIVEPIARRLAKARADREWTVGELAGRSGLASARYEAIEQGIAEPSILEFLHIAESLEVPPAELIGR